MSLSGQPHFGRSIQLGAQHAERVREFFTRHLDAHLHDLGSFLTSEAFTITTESHGPAPTHDTPDSPPPRDHHDHPPRNHDPRTTTPAPTQ
ncbi:hypothetical protein [Streptomyces sp. NPDC058457]|uniref:hypothetical protein n=1 Tax=Streptomyces sp. NPDC058457 TaxID=3346507 RepID=UPI00365983F3